jgi:hypothetical protein
MADTTTDNSVDCLVHLADASSKATSTAYCQLPVAQLDMQTWLSCFDRLDIPGVVLQLHPS